MSKMKRLFCSALAAMIATSLFGATRTDAIREKLVSGDRDYVFVAMHRGDWRNFPENSKGAILSSIRLGADIVELDVHMTKDGFRRLRSRPTRSSPPCPSSRPLSRRVS